ncbi:NAD(P)-dependent oxidoreductase [Sulfuracidifex tepidarius]|uniref:Glyoxylate reductase n=1 Tax=Sulfuracidifex tepidarius TaxID=1294262 RepID=A0A510DU93_9CREN|nr:NAD(P)-dependent oxidoreductase [Sulfuracidifex tepidarius]BBG23803.1 Glyoxylate reductase [Sulfuracidifex tepidarius]BBG26558.1 Glyoxylate reductase [Sulfuracidifex tepidarius]
MESMERVGSINKDNLRVLITDPMDKVMLQMLQEKGIKVDYQPEIERNTLVNTIDKYDVIVVRSRTKVDKEIIERGKNLKIIARAGIGLDNIDVDEAEKRNIKIVYAPGASTDSAVELTIGLMILGARPIYQGINMVRSGSFKKLPGIELAGKTIGIVGLGRIGTKVARVCQALDMKVVAYDVVDIRERSEKMGVTPVKTIDELVKQSDVISFHVTVGKDAKPIVTEEQFKSMKEGTILVNTSRAVAIDGKALLKYIDEKKLTLATDVFWHEPPKEDWEVKLAKHERVLITPHIGAQTKEAQYRVAVTTTKNLIEAIKELGVQL